MNSDVIITGFRPFDRYPINPSWEVAKEIKATGRVMHAQELTVDYHIAREELNDLLLNHPCDTLLLTGLADQGLLKIETLARKPVQFADLAGPGSLNGEWRWQELMSGLLSQGFPTVLSTNAGQYVCESTYWSALQFRLTHQYPKHVAFLHVPMFSDEWTLQRLTQAVAYALDVQQRASTTSPTV